MIHILAIALALAGFAILALAMNRHQQDLIGRRLRDGEKRRARTGGFVLLALIFLVDAIAFGAAYGAIVWFGHLSVGAWGIVAWITWRAGRRPARSNKSAFSEGED